MKGADAGDIEITAQLKWAVTISLIRRTETKTFGFGAAALAEVAKRIEQASFRHLP